MKTFTNLAHRAFKKCASLGTINKKRYYLFIITMLLTLGAATAWAETYKLSKVTSVSAGEKYVFEQKGYVMTNKVTSSKLQCTNDYKKTGLSGTEAYVWTLETVDGGFYMKNVSLSSSQYLNNASSTNVSFGNKSSSIWTFAFDNEIAVVQNTKNSNRFLGYTSTTAYEYKAYAASNLSSSTYPHNITVYKLIEETAGGGENPGEGEEPETPGSQSTATLIVGENGGVTWTNGAKTAKATVGDVVFTALGSGSNDSKYYDSDKSWRFYTANTSGVKITTPEGSKIVSVIIKWKTGQPNTPTNWSKSGTTSPTTFTPNSGINTNEVSFTRNSSANFLAQEITVNYETSSSGSGTEETVASLTADPTSLDFGNVTQNNEVEAKTFTISGSDFTTGELTITAPSGYTVNPSTVSVDGTLGETTITVTPNTSTVGTFNGNVTISGANLKSSVNVALTMTVEKAPATPTDNVYVKVTTTAGITDGEYLIVYEDETAPVAFNGALATLDAAKNTVAVGISNSTIAGNTDIDAALFTIDVTAGTLKSASGKYIGVSSNNNGLKTEDVAKDYKNAFSVDDNGNAVIAADFEGSTMSLRYNNTAGDNNLRFRYYKNAGQQPIALYKKVDPSEILAPAFSVAAGSFYDAQSVVITCATPGAEIYYTLDGSTPTSTSTKYTSAVAISETKTLKAIAIKGEYSSSVTEATYTILAPLATMQEIFDKATAVGSTATPVKVTMNNWVVTGVKGSNAYLTDGTKGLIIYTASHGFVVGDVLSGTVSCKVQLYDGSAELTSLTKTIEGLTVTTGGTVTPVVVNDVTTLGGVNTGSVIKITGTCESGNVVAGVKLYGTLYTFDNLTVGNKYNVTGVYLQYGDVEEILPRKQEDIEEVQDLATATISVSNISLEVDETKTIEATITPDAAKTKVQYAITAGSEYITLNGATITGVAEGTATVTATIAEAAGEYYGTTKDFTITVTPKSTKDKVVILAQYNGQWYAMMAQYVSGKTSHLAALPVSYVGGKLYNVADADKTLIEWDRAVVDGKATFSNNSKYLTGKSDKTDLTLAATSCNWTISGESYLIGERTFFYNAENNWFRNFKIENVDAKNYSGMPVVAAPVYVNLNTASVKTVENAYFSVGDNKYVQFSTGNLQYEVGTNTWSFAEEQYEVIGGAAYDGTNNTNYGMNVPGYTGKLDLFAWSSDGKFGVNPSNTDAHYGYAGSDFVDWGKLVNGTGWYTLTKDEMNNILARTKNGKKLWALATINDLVGLILLPDNWDTNISLVYGYVPTQFVYTENQLTIDQWEELETAGAVFLPAGGSRTGGYGNTDKAGGKGTIDANGHYFHVDNVNIYGYYWLNTQDPRETHKNCASFLILPGWDEGPTIDEEGLDDLSTRPQVWSREKRRGNSVRLVKEVKPDYTREDQGAGVYGTVCYPENIVWVDGATLYEVAGKEGNKVIFDEVTTPEAGKPYIFIADQEVIYFFCGTDEALLAGNYNSLQGTFTQIDPAEDNILVDNYMLVNNIIKKCGINCGLKAYRAYFAANELENSLGAPTASQAPGRRRISLDIQSENTTTGLDNITNGENTTIKVIENGQLIIIRNGEKFNAQGQKL